MKSVKSRVRTGKLACKFSSPREDVFKSSRQYQMLQRGVEQIQKLSVWGFSVRWELSRWQRVSARTHLKQIVKQFLLLNLQRTVERSVFVSFVGVWKREWKASCILLICSVLKICSDLHLVSC